MMSTGLASVVSTFRAGVVFTAGVFSAGTSACGTAAAKSVRPVSSAARLSTSISIMSRSWFTVRVFEVIMELMLKSRPAANQQESQTIPSDTATFPDRKPNFFPHIEHSFAMCTS